MENDKQRTVKGEDNDGNEVVVIVKRPTAQCYNKSQIAYNKSFREALDSGALLRQKLTDYMREQGIWDEKKEEQYVSQETYIFYKKFIIKRKKTMSKIFFIYFKFFYQIARCNCC